MVDEMRWDVMSCAGHPIVKTPNLDRLAREGTRFATAYTCSAVCSPSRYSFFTSRYAHVHGATDQRRAAQREPQLLLPTILKHYGYETAISGKLHFTPARADYDFDYFWSFSGEGPGKLPRWPEYLEREARPQGRASARARSPIPTIRWAATSASCPIPRKTTQTFWITDRAVDFLRQRDQAEAVLPLRQLSRSAQPVAPPRALLVDVRRREDARAEDPRRGQAGAGRSRQERRAEAAAGT